MIDKMQEILGVRYFNSSIDDALDLVIGLAKGRGGSNVFFLNADCLYKAQTDEEYKKIVNRADLLLSDGIGLRLTTRLFGGNMVDNCNGTDLSPKIMERLAREGLTVFFLGGKEGVAQKAAEKITSRIEGLKIVGSHNGYFDNDDEVINKINASKADILFVAMGVPLQEKWISKNRKRLAPKVCLGVGALFDYLSDEIPRAPLWMQRHGLEWSWRILIDPKRMIKRYCIDGTRFVFLVLNRRAKDLFS